MYSKKYYYSSVIQPKELYRSKWFDTKKVLLNAPARELPKAGIQHKRQLCYKVIVAVMDAIMTDVVQGHVFTFPYTANTVVLRLRRLTPETSANVYHKYDWAKECDMVALGGRFYQPFITISNGKNKTPTYIPTMIGRKYFDLHHETIVNKGRLEFEDRVMMDYMDVALGVCPLLTYEGARYIMNMGLYRIAFFLKMGMCVMLKNRGNQFVQFMAYHNELNWRTRKAYNKDFGLNYIKDVKEEVAMADRREKILLESANLISNYFREDQSPYIAFTKKEREEIAEKGYTTGGVIGRNKRVAEAYSSPAFKLTYYYILKHDLEGVFNYIPYFKRNGHKITLKEFITDEKAKRKYFQ